MPRIPRISQNSLTAARLGAALFAGLLVACQPPEPEAPPRLGPADGRDLPGIDLERIQVGDPAPDFTLESYDEGLVTLSDFQGEQKVILVFYRGHW